ncbi:MAG: GNAT family N-acetyltransferase [Thermoclostridium sp.]|nr:GNAT family N-acetyltransferase [Thermoclostridium sp.]
MQIIDFTAEHIETAAHLARFNYEEERGFVPILPPIDRVPDLKPYAQNGFGVAAFEGNTMVGFLCSVPPFQNAFGSTCATGVYSPMGANGAIGDNRARIYARLYQAAAKKWVRAGASSHAICLYAHDRESQDQFFRYGFGLRCADAIRGVDEIVAPPCEGYSFSELTSDNVLEVLPLENMLDHGYMDSPFFMHRTLNNEEEFLKNVECFQPVYFVARHEGRIVAFIRAEVDGETFIQETPGYLHVKGAYCMPEYRGKGLNQTLLNMLIQKMKKNRYTLLGVDFESINPSAWGFWLKYFDAYTHSVVRRVDEKAVISICS